MAKPPSQAPQAAFLLGLFFALAVLGMAMGNQLQQHRDKAHRATVMMDCSGESAAAAHAVQSHHARHGTLPDSLTELEFERQNPKIQLAYFKNGNRFTIRATDVLSTGERLTAEVHGEQIDGTVRSSGTQVVGRPDEPDSIGGYIRQVF